MGFNRPTTTMRRPWIKIEACTPDKPEICVIATHLKMDEDMVMGKLVRLWSWVTTNHIKSDDLSVTKEFIDKLVAKKGFAEAMIKAGWLQEDGEHLMLPNFERHHSDAAKTRALTAVRVARHRALKDGGGKEKPSRKNVTKKSLVFENSTESAEIESPVTSTISESNDLVADKHAQAPAQGLIEALSGVSENLDPGLVSGGFAEKEVEGVGGAPVPLCGTRRSGEIAEEGIEGVEPISINAEPTFRPLHIDSPAAALQDFPSEYVPMDDLEPAPASLVPAPPLEEGLASSPEPSPEPSPEQVKESEAKAEVPPKKGRKKQGTDDAQAMLF